MLNVAVTRAESAKFHRPLVLLHGLWTGPWIWQRMTSYLSHRGWESWTVSPPVPRRDFDVASWDTELDELVRRWPQAPVIVTHGTATVLGARLAERIDAPALVSIAPVVPAVDVPALATLFRAPRLWRARLGGARTPAPRGRARARLVGAARDAALVDDSGVLFRTLARGALRLPAASTRPGLVVSGGADPLSPAAGGAALAARYGWEHRVYPGRGHLAIVEDGWDTLAADTHRWLIRTLGAALLAFLDDEEEAQDDE